LPPKTALPLRALSAYNFYFRDERERILNGGEPEYTAEKKEALLSGHWFRDRSVKRRHRKTHGKVSFTTLSKLISQRWRELTPEHKEFYRQIAQEDLDRYQRELGALNGSSTGGGDGGKPKSSSTATAAPSTTATSTTAPTSISTPSADDAVPPPPSSPDSAKAA